MNEEMSRVYDSHVEALLKSYHEEVGEELISILDYWMLHTKDLVHGGFLGQVDENNIPHPQSPKGAVLNSRILWTFSSAYKVTGNPAHLELAAIAFNYVNNYFIDRQYGGVYWTVDAAGEPLDTKKQVYALAFALYGYSAYYEASNDSAAIKTAIQLYETIEKYSFDDLNTGYLEAFTKEWTPLADLRLSDKDANEKKTMNTHLHVMEAYTALYRIWPDEQLRHQLAALLDNFTHHFFDGKTGHLKLFFDENWNSKSTVISYGHDIEAAWLLTDTANAICNNKLPDALKTLAEKIALAAAAGIDPDGSLWYETEPVSKHFNKEKHWWVQAEAMVGFFNHWQLTADENYLQKSLRSWQYIKKFIKDNDHGEWLWGRNEDGSVMAGQDKAGLWKCPYHNARACMEIFNRTGKAMRSGGINQ